MSLRDEFLLDPDLAFLNHGSFGAVPRSVLADRIRRQLAFERNPVAEIAASYPDRLDDARGALARQLNCSPQTLTWTPNVTFAMNLIARSLCHNLQAGDEIVLTDHEYSSVTTLWNWLADRYGLRVRYAPLPLPADSQGSSKTILDQCTEDTKVIVLSHITSDTALVLPVGDVCSAARARSIVSIVDGAHAPGQIPVDLEDLGCDYYVGDLHKWFASPRATGFLYARSRQANDLESLVVSLGGIDHTTSLAARQEFAGTTDPTAWLTVPTALAFHREHLAPVADGAHRLLEAMEPDMAALGLRLVSEHFPQKLLMRTWFLPPNARAADLNARLRARHDVEVQVISQRAHTDLLRVSVAWYTQAWELERLVSALAIELSQSAERSDRPGANRVESSEACGPEPGAN